MCGHQMNLSMEANQIQGKHAWHAHEIKGVGKGANHGHKGLALDPLWTKVKPKGPPKAKNLKRLSLSLLLDQKWHFLSLLHLQVVPKLTQKVYTSPHVINASLAHQKASKISFTLGYSPIGTCKK